MYRSGEIASIASRVEHDTCPTGESLPCSVDTTGPFKLGTDGTSSKATYLLVGC